MCMYVHDNISIKYERTALHYASMNRHVEIALALMDKCPDSMKMVDRVSEIIMYQPLLYAH